MTPALIDTMFTFFAIVVVVGAAGVGIAALPWRGPEADQSSAAFAELGGFVGSLLRNGLDQARSAAQVGAEKARRVKTLGPIVALRPAPRVLRSGLIT